ncbi:hypothetical protein B0T14DRAFT_567025 [Immersiella caudata]|uniref:RNA-binding protein n=1 Tax=Immersiella caudata TaxID=314043 RepID=A0AA39WRI4_9PEZI|nr:hypothetical protein B0T14DRAFT_567025 [Immersiella caudata]
MADNAVTSPQPENATLAYYGPVPQRAQPPFMLRSRDVFQNVTIPPGFIVEALTQPYFFVQALIVHRNITYADIGFAQPAHSELAPPRPEPQRSPRRFQPSAMALRRLNGEPQTQPLTTEEQEARRQAGVSSAYRGNLRLRQNYSAAIPDNENCSLFITGLPGDATVHTLLRTLHGSGVGRVYSCHINKPQDDHRPGRRTAAAKLIFFEADSANSLLRLYQNKGFIVEGCYTRVVRNRTRVAATTDHKYVTRILAISGPKGVVEEEVLESFFRQHFEYQMDGAVITWWETSKERCLEWRFGSHRAQANAAYRCLRQSDNFLKVRVTFAPDPLCLKAVGSCVTWNV